MDLEKLGKAIKAERLARGLSMDQLTELTGQSKGNLSKIERGEINPTIDTIAKLADAFGYGLGDFLVLAGYTRITPELQLLWHQQKALIALANEAEINRPELIDVVNGILEQCQAFEGRIAYWGASVNRTYETLQDIANLINDKLQDR